MKVPTKILVLLFSLSLVAMPVRADDGDTPLYPDLGVLEPSMRGAGAEDWLQGEPVGEWYISRIGLDRSFGTGQGVVVAIIDTGIETSSIDNLWVNAGEVPNNGIDDDENGYIDDVHGADIYSKTGNVEDISKHGTAVGSIISRHAYNAQIMGVRVFLPDGELTTVNLISKGIRYAVDHGADILNISLAVDMDLDVFREAIDHAEKHGVMVIAGMGNDGESAHMQVKYPAGYPYVIAMGAIDGDDQRLPYSTYFEHIDLSAPGTKVTAKVMGWNTTWWFSGTSCATAVATTFAAVNWRGSETEAFMKRFARDIGQPGFDVETGHGVIQMPVSAAVPMVRRWR